MVANIGPDILCHTLKIALGTAANGEKCATAKEAPKPEFCMPTSIAIAFFSLSSYRRSSQTNTRLNILNNCVKQQQRK